MPAKFSIFTVATLPILPIALACGGDDSGGGKIMVQPDSNTQTQMDAPASTSCNADPSYAGVATGSGTQFAESAGSGSNASLTWGGLLTDPNAGPFDALQIELYSGYTVFQNGIMPTTVQLTGAETGYDTCGACVRLLADIVVSGMSGTVTAQYFATGGTLMLTSTSGNFTGTLSNATFTHVNIDQNSLATTPVGDNCNSSISSVSMNEPITAGSASAVTLPGDVPVRVILRDRKF